MRLQWKYALIINLVVIVILTTFYAIDDFTARNDLKKLHLRDIERGAIFRQIGDKIRFRIEREIELVQEFDGKKIEKSLRSLISETSEEMSEVLDVNVTFGANPRIRASLLDDKHPYDSINFTKSDMAGMLRKRVQIYNVVRLRNGKYATEMIIPYHADFINLKSDESPFFIPENIKKISGLIQILFSTNDINLYLFNLRKMHIFAAIVVVTLLILAIIITTRFFVLKPLENMVEIIERADADDLESITLPTDRISPGTIRQVTTNLVRMLKELKTAHSKRIAALNQFAGGVAHEIGNPLNTIAMTAQHLRGIFSRPSHTSDDIDEAIELLEIVSGETDRLKRISRQFIELNRPKPLELRSIDLNQFLDGVIDEFTIVIKNTKIKFVRNYADDLPSIRIDPTQMKQAIINLIQNAIQAISPKNGSIYVTTKLRKKITEDEVVLEIRDTGIGISDDVQERIFDAYFTTKEREGGIGLGLAITHQITTAHNARIEVKSQVGMGTIFSLIFRSENSISLEI